MDTAEDKAKEVKNSPKSEEKDEKEGKKSPTVLELLIQQDLEAVCRKGINPNTGFYLVDGREGYRTQTSDKLHGMKGVILNRNPNPKRKY